MTQFFRINLIPPLPNAETPAGDVKPMYRAFEQCILGPAKRQATDYRPELVAIAKFIDYLDGKELQEAVALKVKLLREPASMSMAQMQRFGEIALSIAQKLYPNDLKMRRTQEGIFWDRFTQPEVDRFNAANEASAPEMQALVLKRIRGKISPEELKSLERSIIERS